MHIDNVVPYVTEETANGTRTSDIYSRLLKERIIFLTSQVQDDMAESIVAQLLFLEAEDSKKDIYLYINSPGGYVTSGLSIFDTMNYIKPDVSTICLGQACSMGSFLLAAGAKGKRFSLPSSRIMIHQPSGGYSGQATDIEIHAKEILRLKLDLNKQYAKFTGKPLSVIQAAMERDNYMGALEAKKFGLIDKVVSRR